MQKNSEKFKKIDYRPWNLVGIDESINNEDAAKVNAAKTDSSIAKVEKVINKPVKKSKEEIDYFNLLSFGFGPVNYASKYCPVSKYLKNCFNANVSYIDNIRKLISSR